MVFVGELTFFLPAMRLKRSKQSELKFNQHDQLCLYLIRMDELTNRTYHKRINWQIQPSTGRFSVANVDEELFAAYILTFRHLSAPNSPSGFANIQSILKQAAKKANDQDTLNELQRIKEEFDKSPQFALAPYDQSGQPLPNEFINNEKLFDLYLNCHYFHTDARGAKLFFQIPEQERIKAHKAFELSLYRYVRRLHAIVPLVVKYLNSPILRKGNFSVRAFKPGEDNQAAISIVIPRATP